MKAEERDDSATFMARVGLGQFEDWPVLHLSRDLDGESDIFEVPESLLQRVEVLRAQTAEAEHKLLEWMIKQGHRPQSMEAIFRDHDL